jgi:hypothetical protein
MRNLSRFVLGLAAVVALVGSMLPAEAACNAARQLTTSGSAILSPGQPFYPDNDSSDGCLTDYGTLRVCGGTMTYLANGFFWAWGGGNPIIGQGHDNGANKGDIYNNWLILSYYPNYAQFGGAFSHWQYPGTDGCISQTGSSAGANGNPDFQECLVVVLNDLNGPDGSFLALSVDPNAGFDFEFSPGKGFPNPLNLVPVPKPEVLSSTLAGANVNLSVQLPVGSTSLTRANGFDFKCHGNPGEILTGYKIYSRVWAGLNNTTVPPEPAAGDSRALTPNGDFPSTPPWVLRSGPNPVPIGSPVNITVPCNGGNVALCATLTFGGPSNEVGAADWELKYCSGSSSVITCDPTLANPGPKPKIGRKPVRETIPSQDRGVPKR